MKKFLQRSGLVFVAVMMFATYLGDSAVQALSNTSTNHVDFDWSQGGETGVISHVVASTTYTRPVETNLGIYYDNWDDNRRILIRRPTMVTEGITAGNRCHDVSSGDRIVVTISATGLGSRQYEARGNEICADPTDSDATNRSSFYGTYPLPQGNLAQDANTGKFKVTMVIRLYPENAGSGVGVLFRVQAVGSLVATLGGQEFATDSGRGRNPEQYSTQNFTFGSDCSVSGDTIKTVEIYDPDNFFGSAVDGTQRERFYAYITEAPSVGATANPIPTSQYTSYENMGDGGSGGNNGPEATGTRTIGGDSVRVYYPTNAARETSRLSFVMKPNHKYVMVLRNVDFNNTIQARLPTDAIFHAVNCNSGMSGRIDSNPTSGPVEVGNDITFNFEAFKTGNTAFESVYNSERRIWYDNDGSQNNGPAAGEQVMCQETRTNQVLSGNTPANLGSCTAQSNTSANGGQAVAVCAQLIIRPANGTTQVSSTVSPPNGLIRCISIGKRPLLRAVNGDVFSGGAFLNSSGTCPIPASALISSSRKTIGGVNYSSFGSYGVMSLRESRNFGSAGLTAGTFMSDSILFSNVGSPDGYFTGNPPNPSNWCLTNPFSEFPVTGGATSAATSVDLRTLTQNTYFTASNLTIYASSPLPANYSITIRARGNVTISSNIEYADGPFAIGQIPRLIVLSNGGITVNNRTRTNTPLTRLDGIYAATTDFQTCETNPVLNNCESPLDINGAVVVGGRVRPYRTAGGERPDYGSPAESFILRPDTVLSGVAVPGSTDVYIRTTSETEVPPRF